MNNIVDYIKENTKNSKDVFFREISIRNEKFLLIFSEVMTDTVLVSDFVIRSLKEIVIVASENSRENEDISDENILKKKIEEKLNGDNINLNIENTIAINKIKKIEEGKDDIFQLIYSGFVIIIYGEKVYGVEARANLSRSISEPVNESSIKGAKDSFVESIMRNVGLIRNRIKTDKLAFIDREIGRQTKTKVAIMYISDIAKKELVDYVNKKLDSIEIDGILDTNYIEELITDSGESDFPTTTTTQRPDVASYHLLQGKIVVLIDNTPYALVVPAFFRDFVNNIDDVDQKASNVTITRLIRYIALVISIVTPALYISLMTFYLKSIPQALLKSFAIQREGVPYPAFFEAIMMMGAFEILRESDTRSTNFTGSTLSIVGAIVLGEAAVNAGIVSSVMIIVIAITMVSALVFSDINMINALRKWRLIFLIFASIFSITGMGIATLLLVTSLCSTNSFTKSFTYPISPFNFTEVRKNLITRVSIKKDKKRQKILTDNLTKSR